ncbi:MAG: M28 family peptidase [Eubacteriaceae bacterium]|nr:M28 family peptidase [Eubacteriaceae bacterium]
MGLYEKMKSEISLENIYKDMAYLVDEVGERLSGTEEMTKATEYICKRLKENIGEGRIDHFPMYMSYPGDASLTVLSPESYEIPARPVCHIDSTPEEGLEGEVLYLGTGGYDRYEGVDARGKIILTDMNWSPARPEKARIAEEMGAKALIIMNWGASDSDLIQMGAVKTQWGNPTPENENEILHITTISISRKEGEALQALCEQGTVTVNIKAQASRQWITASQPIGRVRGGKSNGEYILMGSHVDAWGKSAICNASGDALNLEIARICYENRDEMKRDVEFVFWDGHEIAEGGGSTWYVDQYWQDLTDNCVAYLNLDNLAIRETTVPGVEGQPELRNLLMQAISEIFGEEGEWHQAYKGGGDSSFFGVGVPYCSFATEYTQERLEELNYAFYSPWLHTPNDTIDKIDRDLLMKHAEYFTYVMEKLANSEQVEYDMKALAEDVKMQWNCALQNAGRAYPLIESLTDVVERYAQKMSLLQEKKESKIDTKLYNSIALACERQTCMFRCYSGKYGQDACGSYLTEQPVPALDRAMKKYNLAEEESHESYLWETEILRLKNTIFDQLNISIKYMELAGE